MRGAGEQRLDAADPTLPTSCLYRRNRRSLSPLGACAWRSPSRREGAGGMGKAHSRTQTAAEAARVVAAFAAKQPGQRAKRAGRMAEPLRPEPERWPEPASAAKRSSGEGLRVLTKGGDGTVETVYIVTYCKNGDVERRALEAAGMAEVIKALLDLGADGAGAVRVYRAQPVEA